MFCILYCLLSLSGDLVYSQSIELRSPDHRLQFAFGITQGVPVYTVRYKQTWLIDTSALNVELHPNATFRDARLNGHPTARLIRDKYHLVVGKASLVSISYNSILIPLADRQDPSLRVDLEVRVFDDGLAFRYHFPGAVGRDSLIIADEKTEFRCAGNPRVKALLLPNYTTSHEGLYTSVAWKDLREDTLLDMPILFTYPDHRYMAITEAALTDYSGMYLLKRAGSLVTRLSPFPGEQGVKVKATFPHYSPWRVVLVGERPGALIESNIITSLNPGPAFGNTAWIKPGTTTFPWWNGTIVPDGIPGGNNFETNKYYIDFCAANQIKYHTVVEYGGHEWYTNEGEGYQPGPLADILRPVDGLDMKRICDYGKQKHVGIRVWTHWKALYPKLDSAFSLFEQWGLSGLMVDFMDRDDQQMVNIQTEILQKAAARHLHIQFHGAYKPTGLNRTYPNEWTREGAMNYEYDKWDKLVTPEADLNIVFTRMLAGPTDYHLGGFRALPLSRFTARESRPYVMGTRCHMLAMYVVLENYLPMVADSPDAYEGQPGFEVLRQIPGTWDETRVPAAEVDKFASIARRSGRKWFVGSITNNESRLIDLNLGFLPPGTYRADVFSDAADAAENPDHLEIKTRFVNNRTIMRISLAPGGGHAMIITPVKK